MNCEEQERLFFFTLSVNSSKRRRQPWYISLFVEKISILHKQKILLLGLSQILGNSYFVPVPLQEVGDPGEYKTFLNSRPPSMELSAIQLVIDICRETGVPCHIGGESKTISD